MKSDEMETAVRMYRALNDRLKPKKVRCDFGPDGVGGWWAGTSPGTGTSPNWTPGVAVVIIHEGFTIAVNTPEDAIEWVEKNLQ